MNTQQRIDRIAAELRDIYQNTNEGPKLIHDLVEREFPYPRKVWNDVTTASGYLKKAGWGMDATSPVRS